MKFRTFAELTQDKSIVPVLSTGRFDVSKDFFSAMLDTALGDDGFDETWYQAQYPDILKGIRDKIIENGRAHYVQFGYFEHRMPRAIVVDAGYYCGAYQDIGLAIKEGRVHSAQWHFEHFGFREGRLPHADWSLFTH